MPPDLTRDDSVVTLAYGAGAKIQIFVVRVATGWSLAKR